jgi:hypothetical protein
MTITETSGEYDFIILVYQDDALIGRLIERMDGTAHSPVWFPEPEETDEAQDCIYYADKDQAIAFLVARAWWRAKAERANGGRL